MADDCQSQNGGLMSQLDGGVAHAAIVWEVQARFHSHPERATASSPEEACAYADDFNKRGARRVTIFGPGNEPTTAEKLRRMLQTSV